MTAKERYARFQRHNTAVTRSWSGLTPDEREAWGSFNEEIEDEMIAAMLRAVRDHQKWESLEEEADLEASGKDCYGSLQ